MLVTELQKALVAAERVSPPRAAASGYDVNSGFKIHLFPDASILPNGENKAYNVQSAAQQIYAV